MRAEGITPAMLEWYQKNVHTFCTKIDKAVEMKEVEKNNDNTVVHMRIITPPMVSNRSIIQTFFEERQPDGTVTFLATSTGNQELETKYAKLIGKDVIAQCFISYLQCKPIKDTQNSYLKYILSIDVAGSLPDFVKKAIGEEQTKGLDNIVNFVRANYKA